MKKGRGSVPERILCHLFYCLQPGCFIRDGAGVSGIPQCELQLYAQAFQFFFSQQLLQTFEELALFFADMGGELFGEGGEVLR